MTTMPVCFGYLKTGHFQKLGSGSYSTVHICELEDGSRIAMKRHGPTILEYMHTILREGLLLTNGYGPKMLGVFTEADGTFMGLGMSLGICTLSKISYYIKLSPTQIMRLGKDIIADLAKLHAANIIHGDLKQANIIVYKDYAKICDFGLASWTSQTGPSHYTSRDEIYTINYRAPELSPIVLDLKTSADIWALGITLFGIIENESICVLSERAEIDKFIDATFPPDYDERHASIKKIIEEKTLSKDLEQAESIETLATIIALCLDRNPSKRPSASDLLALCKDSLCSNYKIDSKISPSKSYQIDCVLALPKMIDLADLTPFTEDAIKLNAKNLLNLINVEANEDICAAVVALSRRLSASMPSWRINVCATLSTSLCVMCVRPTHVLQPVWCARFMNTSIKDYELKLGLALSIAISYPEWAERVWAPRLHSTLLVSCGQEPALAVS